MIIKLNQIENGTLGQILSVGVSGLTYTDLTPKLSSILAADIANIIDNLDFAQTWDWSTFTTGTAFNFNFNSLTTGTGMKLSTNSLAANSTEGLLTVANNSTNLNGIVFKVQSNITDPGITVKADAKVGIRNNIPTSNFDINGSIASNYRIITTTTTLLDTDYIIYVDNGASNISINLLNVDRRRFKIIRFSNTSTGTITVRLPGGQIQASGGTLGLTTTISAVANQRAVEFQIVAGVARRITNN